MTNKPNFNPFRPLIDVSDLKLSYRILAITTISLFAADTVQSPYLK